MSKSAKKIDPQATVIPEVVTRLRDIFASKLEGVNFPGVSLEVLTEKIAEVEEAYGAELKARQALDAASETVADAKSSLIATAMQGLAYARVFAQEDEPLLNKLTALSFGKLGKVAKPAKKASGPKRAKKAKGKAKMEVQAAPEAVTETESAPVELEAEVEAPVVAAS